MPDLICPFRAATGLPCPLCGSTRAVVLAVQGDPGFVRYNAVAVVVLAVVAVWLAVRGVAAWRGVAVPLPLPRGRPLAAVVVAVAALAWAWALAHRDTIVT